MTKLTEKPGKLVKIHRIIYIFIGSAIILGGAMKFGWGYFVAPQIDNRIDIKIEPITKEIRDLKDLMQYQNLILLIDKDKSTRELIDSSYSMLKRGDK